MAGIDGIVRRIDPVAEGFGPVDCDIVDLPPAERERIGKLPTSLREALLALEQDHAFLLRGEVFTEEMIRPSSGQDDATSTRKCATAPTPTR